jgi:hypothetical protein
MRQQDRRLRGTETLVFGAVAAFRPPLCVKSGPEPEPSAI